MSSRPGDPVAMIGGLRSSKNVTVNSSKRTM
jgi:hypothetical protein